MKRVIEIDPTEFTCDYDGACLYCKYMNKDALTDCGDCLGIEEMLRERDGYIAGFMNEKIDPISKERFEQQYRNCPFKNIKVGSKIKVIIEEQDD